MKLFTQWLISTFLFGGTLFFAAGAPVIGAEGAGDGLDLGDLGDGTDDGAGDAEGADASGGSGDSHQRESDSDLGDDSQQAEGRDQHRSQEEPEVQEFKGSVSARLKNLTKQAPELGQVFQKYPKLQEQIEATFRREAALREVFPTVAEARQMREHFPNGLADVQQLHADVAEVETLDKDFYTRDREGNFPGHTKIIDGMFADDREAAVSLFRSLPKEWARLDRESYNEVMGKVVGVTLDNSRAVADLADALESKDPKRIEASATKFLNWADAFSREKPRPSADEERLNRDRASFKQQTAERDREEGQKFHTSFVSESRKLQMQTNIQSIALQVEKVRKNVPTAYEQEARPPRHDQDKRGDVIDASTRNIRLPILVRPGGKFSQGTADFDDMGRGSGSTWDVGTLSTLQLRWAFEVSKLAEYATKGNDKAIENVAVREVAEAMKMFKRFLDCVYQTPGNGQLDTISSISGTTYTVSNPNIFYFNQDIQVYPTGLASASRGCAP
jgi:hypothetical protein